MDAFRSFGFPVLGLPSARSQPAPELGLSEQMDHFEANVLRATLGRFEGDIAEVAQALRLPRRSFHARRRLPPVSGSFKARW